MKLLYSGKAKNVYYNDEETVVIEYTNNATAFNGEKHEMLDNKGILNNSISSLIYEYLAKDGLSTHYIKKIDDTKQLCKSVEILPLEVIGRNLAAGSMCKRYGIPEGIQFDNMVQEFSYKNDELGDPLINDDHILAMKICSKKDLIMIKSLTREINERLKELFDKVDLILVDFKLEFGKDSLGNIILADEISPDTMRLWEKGTLEKFDKDRFRNNLGDTTKYYNEVLKRLEGIK